MSDTSMPGHRSKGILLYTMNAGRIDRMLRMIYEHNQINNTYLHGSVDCLNKIL